MRTGRRLGLEAIERARTLEVGSLKSGTERRALLVLVSVAILVTRGVLELEGDREFERLEGVSRWR